MSWNNTCPDCKEQNTHCTCSIEERRKEMKKESWINNVMKKLDFSREEAERMYNLIYK